MQTDSSTAAIHLEQVSFSYTGKTDNRAHVILNIPELRVQYGEQVFVQGNSGSGKSTLLNLLSGVHTATSGNVSVLGQDLGKLSSFKRDAFRAQNIGVIFQQFNLIPYLSVLENLKLANHFAGSKNAFDLGYAQGLLSRLNMPDSTLASKVQNLSVGQRQRVAIARALVNKPQLILADEPTSALDANNRDSFMQVLLESVSQTGATILFVSHDQSLTEYFPRQVTMSDLNHVETEQALEKEPHHVA